MLEAGTIRKQSSGSAGRSTWAFHSVGTADPLSPLTSCRSLTELRQALHRGHAARLVFVAGRVVPSIGQGTVAASRQSRAADS
jgi:hypothetical protein